VIVNDGDDAVVGGRFWCVCEYAPGEYEKKRKPTVERVAAGAKEEDSYYGEGGAAILFDRGEPLR